MPARFVRPLVVLVVLAGGCAAGSEPGWDAVSDQPEAEDGRDGDGPPPDVADEGGEVSPDAPPADGDCPAPFAVCEAACVDLRSDIAHCGACGRRCTDAVHAVAGCRLGGCEWTCDPGWQDLDGAPGCEAACEGSGAEVCNGVDDDCDGTTDEGFPCVPGRPAACNTPCGTPGSGTCSPACEPPAAAECTPPAESCNGADDDCDGATDDGFPCPRGTSETCTTSCGTPGVRACGSDCTWGPCGAGTEVCNGLDDDCDGVTDDGFPCAPGASGSCTTPCGSTGTRGCTVSCSWGPCAPPAEACNGRDDDCDGRTDNGFACVPGVEEGCTASCGAPGRRLCSAACAWGACSPGTEVCNGLDDDCDGVTDDGFPCVPGAAGSCSTSCGSIGSRTCSSACAWNLCTTPVETCNARDDDCDGSTDEGFRAVETAVGFTVLSSYVPACDGVTQREGLDCNAAIHRHCRAGGCASTGFGPVEASADTAFVTCVVPAALLTVPYTVLAGHHPPCDGIGQLVGPDCSAAVSRYCISLGYASGFGPVEASGGVATLACVAAASSTVIAGTYTELATYHDGCNGVWQRWGGACNAAIKRYCQAAGRASGFGPVENSGDTAYFVCVDA